MSNEPSTTTSSIAGDTATTATTPGDTIPENKASTSLDDSSSSKSKSQVAATAIQSLSAILPSSSSSLSSTTARSLLHDPHTCSKISSLLKQPDSGAGDNNLCRWLYDTFQSSDPDLQLLVLRFLPLVAGLYLSRIPLRIPLAGFEAVLLALYAHETASRAGHSLTVNVPDLSHASLYHLPPGGISVKTSNSTGLNLAVISPSLEPHGTIRSTRRARIVGVALELYYSKVYEMPVESKMDFCDFCKIWAEGNQEEGMRRVPLPCELMQPVLRILGHCLLCPNNNHEDKKKLTHKAAEACTSLYARSMHDVNPREILALGSLLRLHNNTMPADLFYPTDLPKSRVISL